MIRRRAALARYLADAGGFESGYLAQFDNFVGTGGASVPSPMVDLSGNDNDITVTGDVIYSYGNGQGVSINASGKILYIPMVNLGGRSAYELFIHLKGTATGNNRVFVIPTLDFNMMFHSPTSGTYGVKFETTSGAFASPVEMYASGDVAALGSASDIQITLTVRGDVITVAAVFAGSAGTSVVSDSITVTGFTAGLTGYGLYIGNNAAGTRPVNRSIVDFYIKY